MTRRLLTAALALAVVAPTLATAQERQRSRARGTVRERPSVQVFTFNRARLGVTVQTQADPETDRYGARIVSVVEDGPADEAGIKAGDIITKFNSTNLGGAKPEDADEDHELSGPGLRLVELARELDEGDTVRVEYRRDGNTRSATIVAEEVENTFSVRPFQGPYMAMPRFEAPGRFEFYGGPGGMNLFDGNGNFAMLMGGGHGIQMIEMNADLGEYFGISEGLLITRAPGDSAIPLRTGDVLLAIDGRKPSSVAQAFRILHSYEAGETVRAEIMRKRQRMNVEWTIEKPAGQMRFRSMTPSVRPLPRDRQPARERTRL